MEAPPPSSCLRLNRNICVLLLAAFVMHLPALMHPFFIDDYVYVEKAAHINWNRLLDFFKSSTLDQSASGVWWTPSGQLPFYRPVAEVTFAVDYLVWGSRPLGFHLTNLFLHVLCTFLAWKLALR